MKKRLAACLKNQVCRRCAAVTLAVVCVSAAILEVLAPEWASAFYQMLNVLGVLL